MLRTVPAEFLAIYPGLSLAWNSGFRSIFKRIRRSVSLVFFNLVVDGPTRALIPYSILDLQVQSPSGPVRMRKANPMIRVVNWALFEGFQP